MLTFFHDTSFVKNSRHNLYKTARSVLTPFFNFVLVVRPHNCEVSSTQTKKTKQEKTSKVTFNTFTATTISVHYCSIALHVPVCFVQLVVVGWSPWCGYYFGYSCPAVFIPITTLSTTSKYVRLQSSGTRDAFDGSCMLLTARTVIRIPHTVRLFPVRMSIRKLD